MASPFANLDLFGPNILSSLPRITTRQALLILDLQNDFIKPDGALFVHNVPDFLERVATLASSFRESGDVIWIKTVFEEEKPIIDTHGDELVVLGGRPSSRRGGSHRDNQAEDSPPNSSSISPQRRRSPQRQFSRHRHRPDVSGDPEAYLSASKGFSCCRPNTTGSQFPAPILSAIDPDRDTVLVKSDYSAFSSDDLLQSFRSRFITEVFICGSLSNISVYATALDAASHGFSVVLVEDCLGFRRFSRHVDALTRMADMVGANGITSQELMDEQDREEGTERVTHAPDPRKAVQQSGALNRAAGIEDDMDVLAVKQDQPIDTTGGFDIAIDSNAGKAGVSTPPSGEDAEPATSRHTQSISGQSKKQRKSHDRPLGPGDRIGEGDSKIVYDLDLASNTFDLLQREVKWQKMYHMSGQVPRLVAVQGTLLPDKSVPIYRHPADESPPLLPFSPTVDKIRRVVERVLNHPLNHVLIQLYRDGQDRISEHSDKTLDIVRGSYICNVSLGAQRVMTLRSKVPDDHTSARDDVEQRGVKTVGESRTDNGRQSQRVPMPHNSLFILGEQTNRKWLHGIRPDKRPNFTKAASELAFSGSRISLTFRHIGTFINTSNSTIWGQGSRSKTRECARKIIHGETVETESMIRAFGQENHQSDFDWDEHYGHGFDVVNFVTTSSAQLVLSKKDDIANLRVLICLFESGVRHEVVEFADLPSDIQESLVAQQIINRQDNTDQLVYVNPDGMAAITGDLNILSHVASRAPAQGDRARRSLPLTQTQTPPPDDGVEVEDGLRSAGELLRKWRHGGGKIDAISDRLDFYESKLRGKSYLGGQNFDIDDCAFWPVLRELVITLRSSVGHSLDEFRYPSVWAYYHKVGKRSCVKSVLEQMQANPPQKIT